MSSTTTTTFPPNLQHLFNGKPPSNLNYGSFQYLHLYDPLAFSAWEIVLTVAAVAVMLATVVVFVRRIRGV